MGLGFIGVVLRNSKRLDRTDHHRLPGGDLYSILYLKHKHVKIPAGNLQNFLQRMSYNGILISDGFRPSCIIQQFEEYFSLEAVPVSIIF